MAKVINVEGIGLQSFPDDATDDEISEALNTLYPPDPRRVAVQGMVAARQMIGPTSPLGATAIYTADDDEIARQQREIALYGAQMHELLTGPMSPIGATARYSETPEQMESRRLADEASKKGRLRSVAESAAQVIQSGAGTGLEGSLNVFGKLGDAIVGGDQQAVQEERNTIIDSLARLNQRRSEGRMTPELEGVQSALEERLKFIEFQGGQGRAITDAGVAAGGAVRRDAATRFNPNPAYDDEFFAGTLPRVAGSAIGSVAPFLVNPGLGAINMFGQVFQDTYEENLANGVGEDEAMSRALRNGIISGGLESISGGVIAGVAKKLAGTSIRNMAPAALRGLVQGTATEFLTGASQEFTGQLINQEQLDPAEIARQGGLEALGSVFVTGPAIGVGAIRDRLARDRQPSVTESQAAASLGIPTTPEDASQDSQTTTIHGDVLNQQGARESQGQVPTPESGAGVQAEAVAPTPRELESRLDSLTQRHIIAQTQEEKSAIWAEMQAVDQELQQAELKRHRGSEQGLVRTPSQKATTLTPKAYSVPPWKQKIRRFWFGNSGAFPKAVRNVIERGRFNTNAIVEEGRIYGRDLQFEIERAAKSTKNRDAVMNQVNDVMLGGAPLSSIADPGLQDATRSARNYLDSLSKLTLDNGIVTGEMADTFRSNMGQWLKRYYAAFDPEANWNYDSLLKRAYGDPLRRANVKDAEIAKVVRDAETLIRKQNPLMMPVELEAVMRSLTDRATLDGVFLGQSVGKDRVAKAVGSLIRRKDIPEVIRRYMGEETNPLLRFDKSLNFMGQLIARHTVQIAMRDFLLANGLASTERSGRNSVELYPDEMAFVPQRDASGEVVKDANGQPLGEFRTRTDKRMGVFRGMWGSPELKAALDQFDPSMYAMEQVMGVMGKFLAVLSGEAKMAKVPLNPQSWITNGLGGFFMAAQNGTINPFRPVKTAKLFGTSMMAMRAASGKTESQRQSAITKRMREIHTQLIRDGIYDSSVALKDLEATTAAIASGVLESNRIADTLVGAARVGYYGARLGTAIAGPPGAAAGASAGAVLGGIAGGKAVRRALQRFSQLSIGTADNFWKVMAYLDNFYTYQKANPAMRPEEVGRIAGEITRDTMPTYAKIPEGLRTLSKYGWVNSFFQFNYEVIRNTINSFWYATKEMASGNPTLVARGTRRMVGLGALLGISSPVAAQLLSKWFICKDGQDDDEKIAALHRNFVPSWDRNNSLVVTFLCNGKVSYVNQKYLIPQSFITMGIEAVRQGRTPEEATRNVWNAYMDDFLVQGVHVTPFIDAFFRNQKGFRSIFSDEGYGSPVTLKTGVEGLRDKFEYAVNRTFEPGFIREVELIRRGVTGELADYGKQYTVNERLVRFFGLRENTYDLSRTVAFRYRDLDRSWANVRRQESRLKNLALSPEQLDAERAYVEKEKQRLIEEAAELRRGAVTLGIPNSAIKAAEKGVAKALR